MIDFYKINELNLVIDKPEDSDVCAIALYDIEVNEIRWHFLSGRELKSIMIFYITPTKVPWDKTIYYQQSNYWYKNISANL
ncbi:MAG: hypothetical protein WC783_04420 [Candidatus Paceibacterota bacterium]|jgi:hypothetical protein